MHRAELVEHEVRHRDGYTERNQRWQEPVLGLTDVKLQHYIPRMYMRGFASADGLVRVVDVDSGDDKLRTVVRNVGAKRRFYNFGIKDVEVSTEAWLSELEGLATPLLDRLIADPAELVHFTRAEQMDFARFLAAFRFRVPAFHEQMDALRAHMVREIKRIARGYIANHAKTDPDRARKLWELWEEQPDEWWLQQDNPFHPPELTAQMLEAVQGPANLLYAMPWRIGRVPVHLRLYTSDNPMQGRLQPICPWWEAGAFATVWYYVPLSPSVLLRIAPLTYRPKNTAKQDPGARIFADFSGWHAAMTMLIQSSGATQYLYGDGGFFRRDEAQEALARMELTVVKQAKIELNWSADEPPEHTMPDGRVTTPAPVAPVQKQLAAMRKLIHERRGRA